MNNDAEHIRKWINDNLVMQNEARKLTEQSISAFSQAVQSGLIKPFVSFGDKRKTYLYLKSDLETYKNNKRKIDFLS
jgi:hypothetical protein